MIIENLAGRNIGDAPLSSSTRKFPLRVPYEGVFDFLRDFVTLLSRFGRAVAAWNWLNLSPTLLLDESDDHPFVSRQRSSVVSLIQGSLLDIFP